LLSVDPSYFPDTDKYVAQAQKLFEQKQVDWPNAFLPGGWNDVARVFNLSGYGLTLVDARGIVRAVNIRPNELEKQVRQLLEVTPAKPES
jgi:hypothetical protein